MAIPANWPQDVTDLANRAMQKLGEKERFTDIATATTDNAETIQECLYDVIRDAQMSFPWPELETFTEISTADATFTDTTGYAFSYRFALPDDYLRPLNEELYQYQIRGAYVYANLSEDLPFHYIRYDEDVSLWSPSMFKVIMYRLAAELCLPITQSPEILGTIEVLREKAESEAKRLKSYGQKWPNQRRRRRGELSRLRSGIYGNDSGFLNGNG